MGFRPTMEAMMFSEISQYGEQMAPLMHCCTREIALSAPKVDPETIQVIFLRLATKTRHALFFCAMIRSVASQLYVYEC